MTARSPYAPLRRQSSSLSNASNNSFGVGGAAGGLSLIWLSIRFWRRILLTSQGNGKGKTDDGDGDGGSGRGAPSVIRWLGAIIGGEQSVVNRLGIAIMKVTREVLLRSIGATSIIFTGNPTPLLHWNANGSIISGFGSLLQDPGKLIIDGHEGVRMIGVETIKRDRQRIDHVLSYWFGQMSPDGAQKSLWMIASSSTELLNRVDSDITDKFTSLIILLSSTCSTVADIYDEKNSLSRWTGSVDLFGWQGKMAAIIALDQMSRHIHRHSDILKRDAGIPPQKQLDRMACDIAKRMQHEHKTEFNTGMIPLPMRIFAIMPFRHASTVLDLSIVQEDVEASSVLHDEMERMIRRFRKATNRRMAALQDEVRREGKLGVSCDGIRTETITGEDEQHILECSPFEADMTNACDHVVVKTMSAFLRKMNILQINDAQFKKAKDASTSRRSKEILSTSSLNKDTPPSAASNPVPTAIVSLSGGVDSMVIASSLAYLRDTLASRSNKSRDAILRIVAIHIDYANRPESQAEAMYVEKYCQELGAEFVCRRIGEVTRGVTARDDYERIAREIRFDLYRQCCAEASNGTNEHGIGIMLGHHRGDIRENVISNAHKGCGPLDLSGMTSVSR
jgi:tRNA(Ile)-lysidine synthase TilS/MesJ